MRRPIGRTRLRLAIVAAAFGTLGLAACTAAAPPSPTSMPSVPTAEVSLPAATSTDGAAGDFARKVDIGGGRRLYLQCRGSGKPTVLLEAGLRNRADVWESIDTPDPAATAVFPAVAADTRVCAYDRPGTASAADVLSRSDPAPMPRTAGDAVADLKALLTAAGEAGPYVLVGHSTGGLIARLYASTYPDDVAGLVLVDALPEAMDTLMSPEYNAIFNKLNVDPPRALADYADLEVIDFPASYAQMRAAAAVHPLGRVPLFVLSRSRGFEGLPRDLPADFTAAASAAWKAGQDQLATLRPDARHTVVPNSGHFLQLEHPDAVVGAIKDVVAAVRVGGE